MAEAMLIAWRRFDDAPDGSGDRRAWLFGIVRNTILNANRSEARQAAVAVRIVDTATIVDTPDHADDVARRLDLAHAWAQLPTGHQEVLALAVFEQLSSPHAARVLGISGVAFRARLARARRALQSLLPPPLPTPTSLRIQEAQS